MMIKRLLAVVISVYSFNLYADDTFNDYLLAYKGDVELNNGGVSDMNEVGSWLEEAQFRFNTSTPTRDIDIKKNLLSYEIRVKPKAWGQREIEKDILALHSQQYESLSHEALSFSFKKRYLELLSYVEKYNTLRHQITLSDVLNQEKEFIQNQVTSDQFNPSRLLDAEEKLQENQYRVKFNLGRLNKIQTRFGFPLDSLDSLKERATFDWLISTPEIQSNTIMDGNGGQFSPDVLNAKLNLQLSQSKRKLLKVKKQIGVNLLKFEYGDRRDDEMDFQVGINIPLGASFSDVESQHKIHAEKMQLITRELKTKHALDEIGKEISWFYEEFELQKNNIARVRKYLRKEYMQENPELMIKLRKKLISCKQRKEAINQKVRVLYLNHLALSGQLIQKPLRNWIHEGIPELLSFKD